LILYAYKSRAILIEREYFLNADFDPTLRGDASLLETTAGTFLHEMAWHYLFAAGESDSVVIHQPLPQNFIDYISRKEIALPRTILHPEYSPNSQFTPFGWNDYTIRRLAIYSKNLQHPPIETIKLANSRVFHQGLEKRWVEEDGLPWSMDEEGGIFATWASLEKFLHEHPRPKGWMLKGNHGHAGTANRHIPAGPLNATDQKNLALILVEHGKVALEPWHERVLDMSANFWVDPGGAISDFRGHELFNSRDGTFLGVKLIPNRQAPSPWDEGLRITGDRLGKALADIGYFGPVSMDAYVWQSQQGPQLRPLVDINARYSMALPIHGLGRRLPGKTLLWIWMKPRKLRLPDPTGKNDYEALDASLGKNAFSPASQTGILATSPVWNTDHRNPVKRIGFLISADGEDQLAYLRQAFALALGRK
jgi:hypothetical protein